MKKITINLPHKQYQCLIDRGIFKQLNHFVNLDNEVVIITDANVFKLYEQDFPKNVHIIKVIPGEESKSLPVYEKVMSELLSHHYSRNLTIISVAGGVIGDLAGFVASTYLRGVKFIQVPTTLLSQIDSSIGGKLAINFNTRKNVIGAFYHPDLVLIDPLFLNTLSQRQFKVCEIVNLTAEELLLLWLKPENFRMIDMNLRGNLREPAMKKFLEDKNLPTKFPKEKYPKFDLICNNIKIQVKGPSKSLSNPNLMTIGVEVMGSHGKGAIRRYSETDFDYLGIVIDPQYIPEQLGLDLDNYHFCFVPTKDLPLHYRNNYEWETNDKLYDVAKFLFKKIDDKVYLIPNNAYQAPRKFKDDNGNIIKRQPVSFRNNSIYEINCIPEEFKKQ